MDSHPGPEPSVRSAIQDARLEFAFGGQPVVLTLSIVLAAMTAGMLHPYANPVLLFGWLGVLALVNAIRLLQRHSYNRARARGEVDVVAWDRKLILGCLASGLLWGLAAVLFFPPRADLQFFLTFVIAGVSAGAVSGLAAAPLAAYAFVVPCVLPLAVRLFSLGGTLYSIMGIMTLLYIVMVGLAARRGYGQLSQLVSSRREAQISRDALASSEVGRRLSDERLRIATEAGRIGVWEWEPKSGVMLWDQRTRELYGYGPDEPISYETWRLRVHPADIAPVEAALNDAMASGGPFECEQRILWPDGQERTIRVLAKTFTSPVDGVTRMTGISMDITDQKRLERMKSEFVSIVSHELRTPLTSIRGSLGLVANNAAGELPPRARDILQLAERNAERLGTLIDDLLDVERLDAGTLSFHFASQPLLPLVKEAISANAHYAARLHVQLEFVGAPSAALASVDATRLLQVLANLLSNAVKFSPAGSTVEVAVIDRPGAVRVEVRDRGPGIAPEFRPTVFSKFSQADASDVRMGGGTGLGLAISKAIIEQMGGAIGFETAVGVGSTFHFELPLSGAPAKAAG